MLPVIKNNFEFTELELPKCKKTIRIKPYSFKDEKTLLIKIGDRKNAKVVFDGIKAFLRACVHEDDLKTYEAINKTDFSYLMMKMRQMTKGDKIELKHTCKHEDCKFKFETFLSIETDLKVTVPETNQISLLDGAITIKLKDTPIDEEIEMAESNKDMADRKMEFLYKMLYNSVEEISYEGEVYSDFTTEQLSDFLDDLPGSENRKLLEGLHTKVSSIKFSKKLLCPKCKKENLLEQDSFGFFFY